MIDIVERLRFDAARCEVQFSKGVAGNIDEAADQIERLRNAAIDALAGWKYIREHHGDLYGVGWDRVETALEAALSFTSGVRKSET